MGFTYRVRNLIVLVHSERDIDDGIFNLNRGIRSLFDQNIRHFFMDIHLDIHLDRRFFIGNNRRNGDDVIVLERFDGRNIFLRVNSFNFCNANVSEKKN